MPEAKRTPPGATYAISRRTEGDACFFPSHDRRVRQAMLYFLSTCLVFFGLRLHTLIILPDRWSMILTDPNGLLPKVFEIAHLAIAQWLNVFHRRRRSKRRRVWKIGEIVRREILYTEEDVLEHAATFLAQPVEAGLVEHGGTYPGFAMRPGAIGKDIVLHRPEYMPLATKIVAPPKIILKTYCPPHFPSLASFKKRLARRLKNKEARLRAKATEPFAGREALQNLAPFKPLTQLTHVSQERAEPAIEPTSPRDEKRRQRQLADQRRWFHGRYRPAWNRYRDHDRDTPFPWGTYWRVHIEKLSVEGAPRGYVPPW